MVFEFKYLIVKSKTQKNGRAQLCTQKQVLPALSQSLSMMVRANGFGTMSLNQKYWRAMQKTGNCISMIFWGQKKKRAGRLSSSCTVEKLISFYKPYFKGTVQFYQREKSYIELEFYCTLRYWSVHWAAPSVCPFTAAVLFYRHFPGLQKSPLQSSVLPASRNNSFTATASGPIYPMRSLSLDFRIYSPW